MPTIGSALDRASARLNGHSARSDTEVLLRHVTGLSRTELLLKLDRELDQESSTTYYQLIDRFEAGEPLQYLTGHMEFYGLDFYVNRSVLIPRPETEIMVEKAIEIGKRYPTPIIADVGSGSGAVAVTLAKHLPQSRVIALDVSTAALEIARRNAARPECTNIEFIKSDLLGAVPDRHFDIICANLPYVPSAESQSNRFEPQLALDGGPDGLNAIHRLIRQMSSREDKPEWLLLEFGTGQAPAVKSILDKTFPGSQTEILRDFIPLDRISVTKL
ncbi:peptide chain release factor N(5)-glutamine methyltransferase [Dehalogenimonas etheniformans]|uniref:Release factor glutamine methyltransferase n=1 Tax=Dehalogenimonas etheniformans TaxID=1536648 RepID=A0A2P5P8F9_9CHLR|nr:peptide chain release factor N(5)-glutamine methyltransferase [Dehalogenimonas etheniformans]PPD58579.1 peptide chain release factor N(5)-glutamine methyltransferase [Dehalogenimonas etheniformans]QNT76657.1 peptide chain release factor N(5)-glutamine methyltransferase [Dehalogenimonas etheniformans]